MAEDATYCNTCIWRPRGLTPVEFRGDLWHQKTRFPGLLCGTVSVILRLAVLVELRVVICRQTDRQTQAHSIYRDSIASRGNKCLRLFYFHIYFIFRTRGRLNSFTAEFVFE